MGRTWAVLCNALAAVALAVFIAGCPGVTGPCGDGSVCDDDNLCTVDTCSNGVDTNGEAVAVCSNDPVVCTNGVCNPDDGLCVECVEDADCDDGQFCNGAETCNANNTCDAGTAPCDAAAGETCNEEADRCDLCSEDTDCDDGDGCTADVCSNGQCTNDALVCDDNNPCTDDTCDPATEEGCVFTPVVCSNGLVCNPADGECVECVSSEDCPEGQICTDNVCGVGGDCTVDEDCNDGAFCNGVEVCSNGTCEAGVSPCEEGQTCDEAADECVLPPNPPVVTVPSDATAQIGEDSPITGVSVSDADNNTLTVKVESTDGFVSFAAIAAGVNATDAQGNAVAANQQRLEINLQGTIANLNTTLNNLLYTTDRVAGNPGNDQITVTATDINGGSDTETFDVGIGVLLELTAGDDTDLDTTEFGDLIVGDTPSWLGQGDVIDGLGGNDTVQLNNATGALPDSPTGDFSVTNVEHVFLNDSAGNTTLDLADIDPANLVTWAPGGAHTLGITNAPDGFTLAIDTRNAASGGAVTVAIENSVFGNQSFTLELRGTLADALTLPDLISAQIETVNIVSEGYLGATGITNTITSVSSTAGTINISGSQNLTLAVDDQASRTINAAALTGNLNLTTDGASAGVVATGGEGDDTFIGGTDAQAFSGGAGADTFTAGDGDDQLTGGEGADTFVFEATAAANGLDTITDFATEDVLDFAAFAGDDAPAGTLADTSTGDQAVADNEIWIVTDADGSLDTAAEIAALFAGGGTVFDVPAGNEDVVLIIQHTADGGSTTIWYVDNDGTGAIAAGEVVQVATLDGFNGTIADGNIAN